MSLIHEALKRADAERSQQNYSPPPIDAPTPKTTLPKPRRRRTPKNWARNASAVALLILCGVAVTWTVWTFAGGSPGPRVAYGIPQRLEGGPESAWRQEHPVQERSPSKTQPDSTGLSEPACPDRQPEALPRISDEIATVSSQIPQPPSPTVPVLDEEHFTMARRQWQQVIDASGRRLRGLVQSGIEAGTRVDLFLQEAAAFVSARRKAQEELARQAREKRRREQQRAEAARIAAEKARQEEAREEARRLAAEKARQEQLRKQQEQARLAREKARREALARAEAEAEARAAESAVACVEDTGSQEGSADRQDSQPEFVLNGILFSYDRIDAVINNKSYQLNETVNGAKVIHIERTMVKLLYKGEVIVLRL